MATAEPTLEEKLHGWLATQGYPLEMKVARAFQEVDASVIQSDYYSDPITSESREIDVVAYWQTKIDGILLRVNLTIECKSSRDKPWILFVSRDAVLSSRARIVQRAASGLAGIALVKAASHEALQDVPLLQLPDAPAYGMRQAFTDNDHCYGAITSVAAAVAAQVCQPDFQDGRLGRTDLFEVVLPVIVTEARLFSALLDTDREVKLTEKRTGVLLWRNPAVNLPHTIIHVVSTAGLPEFAAMASESAKAILAMFTHELKPQLLAARDLRVQTRALASE